MGTDDKEIFTVKFELTRDKLMKLENEAVKNGFMREDPRKRWTMREVKEAARWEVMRMVKEKLGIGSAIDLTRTKVW